MHIFACALQRFNHVKSGSVFKPEVDDSEGRGLLFEVIPGLRDRPDGDHAEAALAQRTRQTGAKRGVIVQDEERFVFKSGDPRVGFDCFFHAKPPAWTRRPAIFKGASD
jgi:hypothetical protein